MVLLERIKRIVPIAIHQNSGVCFKERWASSGCQACRIFLRNNTHRKPFTGMLWESDKFQAGESVRFNRFNEMHFGVVSEVLLGALLGTAGEVFAELCKRFLETILRKMSKNGNKKNSKTFGFEIQTSVFGSNGGGLLEKTKIKCSRRVMLERKCGPFEHFAKRCSLRWRFCFLKRASTYLLYWQFVSLNPRFKFGFQMNIAQERWMKILENKRRIANTPSNSLKLKTLTWIAWIFFEISAFEHSFKGILWLEVPIESNSFDMKFRFWNV